MIVPGARPPAQSPAITCGRCPLGSASAASPSRAAADGEVSASSSNSGRRRLRSGLTDNGSSRFDVQWLLTTNTGLSEMASRLWVTLPTTIAARSPLPWLPMITMPAFH